MDIVNKIVSYIIYLDKDTDLMRIQKYLYYIQICYAVQTNKLAFDVEMKAWMYGSVIPEIYSNKKDYYKNIDFSSLDDNLKCIIKLIVLNFKDINIYSTIARIIYDPVFRSAFGKYDKINNYELKKYHRDYFLKTNEIAIMTYNKKENTNEGNCV